MDENLTAQIVAAAAVAAGPVGDQPDVWSLRVSELAQKIAAMSSQVSPTGRAVGSILAAETYVGTILEVTREQSSTRPVVRVAVRPSKYAPDGVETIRGERTDNPVGLAFARRLRSLVGHRVMLWKEKERSEDGSTAYKTLRWVEDLGEDRSVANGAA